MYLLLRIFKKLAKRYKIINRKFLKTFTYYIYIYFFRKLQNDLNLHFWEFVEEQKCRYFEIITDLHGIQYAKLFLKVFLNICNKINL